MEFENVKVNDLDIVFFDTEATSLEMNTQELIEIGLVKVKAQTFEILEERDIKIKPVHIETANKAALEIVGYDPVEWEREGVDLKTGIEEFLSIANGSMLAGHAIVFDWSILKKSIEQVGLKPNFFYKGIDTYSIAWQKLRNTPGFNRYSLRELAAYFGIDQGRAHRAIDDARTTYQIFLKLIT